MRQLLILTLAAFMLPLLGCGGTGGHPPEGYGISDGWVTLPDGLRFKDTKSGTGTRTYAGASVTVNYTGKLADGTIFDTTDGKAEPFTFTIGQGAVIPGWDEGLMNLPAGSITELIIPPSLGYGDEANGTIPAGSTLYFTVEILSVR
jgi:FKBP-type peptidyl-prolyl cis-trans isomerase